MAVNPFKDLAGSPFTEGCYVVYAALWSRSATLKYGKVVNLVVPPPDTTPYRNPVFKLQVVSVDRTYKNAWELQGKDKVDPSKGRLQTLSFLDRILRVSEAQVPEEARVLLATGVEPEPSRVHPFSSGRPHRVGLASKRRQG
jgi:hypothetical protein